MSEDLHNLRLRARIREILKEQIMPDAEELGSSYQRSYGEPTVEDINFDLTPEELIKYLKSYIVGQDRAIEITATKICTHFHRMKLERMNPDLPRIVGHVKSNMLLIGPTGVGKTYLIRLIAHKLRVPFVKGDATKFSETGYVGGDVEDLVRELVYQAGGNIPLAEYGIIYIDEIDKIASTGNWNGPDVSRSGVQRNLLKLLEETEVDLKVPHDLASQMEAVIETQRTGKASRKKINTRNILFVMSGAFTGLSDIIARRLKKGGMGFTGERMTSTQDVEFLLQHLHTRDLIEYGFESEFVGRIPVVTWLNDLSVEALFGILNNPNSAVIQGKKRDFASYGIDLSFEPEALWFIAREAEKHNTGARGLVTVIEDILLPFERSLPSAGVERLEVTVDLCKDPVGHLDRILDEHAFSGFCSEFLKRSGIVLEFPDEVREAAKRMAITQGRPLREFLETAFKDFEHGLKLLGKDNFKVTRTVLADPKGYLDRTVKRTFQKKTG